MTSTEQKPGQFAQINVFQNEEHNFVSFAQIPEYRLENKNLIRETVANFSENGFMHIDVASGTGLVAAEIALLSKLQGKSGTVICIEPDSYALTQARSESISDDQIKIEFIRGIGESLPIQDNLADGVSMHDALHEVRSLKNKRKVLAEMYRVGKPGAHYSWNSAFTTEAMGNDANAKGYGRWIAYAFRELDGRGKKDDEKVKLDIDQDESTKIYTPDEYFSMITEAGFIAVSMKRCDVVMTPTALKAISNYPRFVEGVLESFQAKDGSERIPSVSEMSEALATTIDKRNIGPLNRVWIEITARKPQ